jgi:hypothetical protein
VEYNYLFLDLSNAQASVMHPLHTVSINSLPVTEQSNTHSLLSPKVKCTWLVLQVFFSFVGYSIGKCGFVRVQLFKSCKLMIFNLKV